MLVTESSVIDPNRNSGIDKKSSNRGCTRIWASKKVFWVHGPRGSEITYDHVEGLAGFVSPGKILLGKPFAGETSNGSRMEFYKEAKQILAAATDAKVRSFETIEVEGPDPVKVFGEDYRPDTGLSVAYVNYLLVKDAVIMAALGNEKADAEAKRIINGVSPERKRERAKLRQLALQGGGKYCATQQIIWPSRSVEAKERSMRLNLDSVLRREALNQ